MATRKNASKTSKKATINFNWNEKDNKKASKTASKTLKSLSGKTILTLLLVLVISAIIGLGASFILTKNDCFNIVGNDELTLTLGESYFDEGVKVIAFNKVCHDISIETNLIKNADGTYSADEVGTYYIKYVANHFKYNSIFKVQKIRLITFVEPSEGEIIEDAETDIQPASLCLKGGF